MHATTFPCYSTTIMPPLLSTSRLSGQMQRIEIVHGSAFHGSRVREPLELNSRRSRGIEGGVRRGSEEEEAEGLSGLSTQMPRTESRHAACEGRFLRTRSHEVPYQQSRDVLCAGLSLPAWCIASHGMISQATAMVSKRLYGCTSTLQLACRKE